MSRSFTGNSVMIVTPISPPVLIVVCSIACLLVASTVWIWMRKRFSPQKDSSELEARIRSWWVICILFLSAILAGGLAGVWLFGFVSYLAFKEYISLTPFRQVDRRVMFWAYLAIPFQYYYVGTSWFGMFLIFIPVYMFLIIPMRLVSLQEPKGFLVSAGMMQWGLMITVFCLSHVAWLFMQPTYFHSPGGPAGHVLYLVGLTEFNDIAQFVWGKAFGKTKILPKISPKKTWAGFLGGVGSTMALSALLGPFLTPMSIHVSILIGAGIAAFGFLGDVTVSALKRDLAIKDTGGLLPGHGGILDRIDSLLFTAPLFVHFLRFYYA